MAGVSDGVLLRGVDDGSSLRGEYISVLVSSVCLGPAATCRRGIHHLPDPRPHPPLLHASSERCHSRRTRQQLEVSHRHHLQREPSFFVEDVVIRYAMVLKLVVKTY